MILTGSGQSPRSPRGSHGMWRSELSAGACWLAFMCFEAHVRGSSRCGRPDGVKDVAAQGKSKAKIEAEVEDFDWSRVAALSDKDIESAAKPDPDTVLLSDAELAEADLVIPAKARRKGKQAAE